MQKEQTTPRTPPMPSPVVPEIPPLPPMPSRVVPEIPPLPPMPSRVVPDIPRTPPMPNPQPKDETMENENTIRQALADNARGFHPQDRRDGVVLIATVGGVTYRARTSTAVWRIPAIEAALATTSISTLAAPVAATLEVAR